MDDDDELISCEPLKLKLPLDEDVLDELDDIGEAFGVVSGLLFGV